MNTSALRLALLLALVVTATASALALRTPRLWHPLESSPPEWRGPTAPRVAGSRSLPAHPAIRPAKAIPVTAVCPRSPAAVTIETPHGSALIC